MLGSFYTRLLKAWYVMSERYSYISRELSVLIFFFSFLLSIFHWLIVTLVETRSIHSFFSLFSPFLYYLSIIFEGFKRRAHQTIPQTQTPDASPSNHFGRSPRPHIHHLSPFRQISYLPPSNIPKQHLWIQWYCRRRSRWLYLPLKPSLLFLQRILW